MAASRLARGGALLGVGLELLRFQLRGPGLIAVLACLRAEPFGPPAPREHHDADGHQDGDDDNDDDDDSRAHGRDRSVHPPCQSRGADAAMLGT